MSTKELFPKGCRVRYSEAGRKRTSKPDREGTVVGYSKNNGPWVWVLWDGLKNSDSPPHLWLEKI